MCVFCDIISGKIPSYKVYEDDNYLVILDISQTTYGHTLVMPKKHYENILEMPNEEAKQLFAIVHKVANDIVNKLDAKGVNILSNTNPIAGQTVMHTHIHIIPRYDENDTIKVEFTSNEVNLEELIKKLH